MPDLKNTLTAIAAVGVIAASCLWIYHGQTSKSMHNVALHQRVGEVLAEQTAELIGHKGKVVTIAIETKEWPELKTQIEAFNKKLKTLGTFEVRGYEMDTKDQPKYGVGTGLSGRRYIRTVLKNKDAAVFVSFIGAPKLDEAERTELETGPKPKLIAEARGTDYLPKLFKHQLIQVAVAARYQYPSPAPESPKTPDEWFTKHYQIVTPQTASTLPKPEKD